MSLSHFCCAFATLTSLRERFFHLLLGSVRGNTASLSPRTEPLEWECDLFRGHSNSEGTLFRQVIRLLHGCLDVVSDEQLYLTFAAPILCVLVRRIHS